MTFGVVFQKRVVSLRFFKETSLYIAFKSQMIFPANYLVLCHILISPLSHILSLFLSQNSDVEHIELSVTKA